MNKLHWFEAKQLDRVTNYSTETEILKYAIKHKLEIYYYCSFANEKKYYGLQNNIKYLGIFKNKYLKAIEFQMLVIIKAILVVISENNSVLMVNQNLIFNVLPALKINSLFRKKNKFISDIRTTPTCPANFESEMKEFHNQFKNAVNVFDGFSFITPFMERFVMNAYDKNSYQSVNWSSGVDIGLFDPQKYSHHQKPHIFKIFYHGGISISRGNLNLIKAVENIVSDGYNVELIQIGILVDDEILKYIKDNRLTSWCKILPPVPLADIPEMIACCDLPVLPFPNFMGWRVSSPIKLMEYLAMGKKVLAPDMEAFTEVFGSNSNLVFYFKTNAENQIAEIYYVLKQIIEDNVLKNGNFYPEARSFVAKRYTWEKQAQKLVEFCNKL